jgi:Uma2 family endonuclease
MTAEEFFEWSNRPENQAKEYELVRGEIVEMSRPGRRHGFVCMNVGSILRAFAIARKKGYVCSNDTGVVVERDPDTVRGPDVMLFEDVTTYQELPVGYGEQPPLVSVEVLSPNDTHGEIMRRVREQIRFGTRLVWVVDPEARNVSVYRPGQEPYVVEENEELTGEDVLPGFRCRVAEFFAFPGQV